MLGFLPACHLVASLDIALDRCADRRVNNRKERFRFPSSTQFSLFSKDIGCRLSKQDQFVKDLRDIEVQTDTVFDVFAGRTRNDFPSLDCQSWPSRDDRMHPIKRSHDASIRRLV